MDMGRNSKATKTRSYHRGTARWCASRSLQGKQRWTLNGSWAVM